MNTLLRQARRSSSVVRRSFARGSGDVFLKRPLSSQSVEKDKSAFAVVMDIDGVLYRGAHVIPGAIETINLLRRNRIPHIFMTNGGGQTEEERARYLSKKLSLDIPAEQVQLAHTPMKTLVPELRDKLVLVAGKPKSKQVAETYGFRNVVSVEEYHDHFPHLYPDIPAGTNTKNSKYMEPVAAILVFMEPEIWGREMQILCDVLRSDGRPGSLVDKQVVPIYFSCPDFEYVTEYDVPRFGAGVFGMLLSHLYENATNRPLQSTWFGKPEKLSYLFAETTLTRQAQELGYSGIHQYYMIGDNPHSDIAGALGAGHHWSGILVRTGIYQDGDDTDFDPHHITHSVRTALDLIASEQKTALKPL